MADPTPLEGSFGLFSFFCAITCAALKPSPQALEALLFGIFYLTVEDVQSLMILNQ